MENIGFMMKMKDVKKIKDDEIPNQEEVWDKIGKLWKDFRSKPLKEVELFLKDKSEKLLDLGCGSGRNFIQKKDLEIYGVDFSGKMLELAEKYAEKEDIDVKLFKAYSWNLPFKDNFFDNALFIATLHCIPDKEKREKSLKELKRVLKKKGKALITVWDKKHKKFDNADKEVLMPWEIRDNQTKYYRYYYLYDKQEFIPLLKKFFKIVKIYEYNRNEKNKSRRRFSKRNLIVEVENI